MVARLDRLYGLRPGVDTLYQLTPWSWLVDYFSNLGDVIENLNSLTSDGLVIPYAYMMAEKRIVEHTTLQIEVKRGSVWSPLTVGDRIEYVYQRRIPASPFGFGISDGDLTPKQISILAALGISRR
jgi:hypothetical protein